MGCGEGVHHVWGVYCPVLVDVRLVVEARHHARRHVQLRLIHKLLELPPSHEKRTASAALQDRLP